jgi:hypothetical protein
MRARVMPGVMCLLLKERSGTMRAAGIILALLCANATGHAQVTVERVGTPGAAIGAVGWYFPVSPPPRPKRGSLTLRYEFPERPWPQTGEQPPEESHQTMPIRTPRRPEPEKHAPVVRAYFQVENRGERVIKAVGWEVSLMDEAAGRERRRLRFRTKGEVWPGQTVTQRRGFPLDDDWRWLEASEGRGVRVVVSIRKLVYGDGSEWRRE